MKNRVNVTAQHPQESKEVSLFDFFLKKYGMGRNVYSSVSTMQYIQVDHTTRCNLLCPQCGRVGTDGKVNKAIPMLELSLEDYKKVFTKSLTKTLERIFFCGNFGDAIASNTFIPCLEYLRETGFERMDLVTNGSLRSPEWWRHLAKILHKPKDLVVFSIDGLEDTNHLYRVNSRWDKIMENVEAFIKAGGRARWDMLVFEHNEHQVEQVRKLAKKMGFIKFSVKKTNRFVYSGDFKPPPQKVAVSNKKGSYTIDVPQKKEYVGTAFSELEKIKTQFGSWEKYADQTEIECKFRQNGNGLFLDFNGQIWPCTWIAALPYTADELSAKQINKIEERYGKNFNSIRTQTLRKVLNGPWFKKELMKSWQGAMRDKIPKMSACSRNCGKMYHHTSSSERNRDFTDL